MAVPARLDPAGQDPVPERKPDLRHPGWADVRRAMVTEARACALAVAEMGRRPGDRSAVDMAELTVSVLQSMGDLARRLAFDEQLLEQERQRAYDEGVAACKAARCRLEVVRD